jgi:hypothetical protein
MKNNWAITMVFKGHNSNPHYKDASLIKVPDYTYPQVEAALGKMTVYSDAAMVIKQIKDRK